MGQLPERLDEEAWVRCMGAIETCIQEAARAKDSALVALANAEAALAEFERVKRGLLDMGRGGKDVSKRSASCHK